MWLIRNHTAVHEIWDITLLLLYIYYGFKQIQPGPALMEGGGSSTPLSLLQSAIGNFSWGVFCWCKIRCSTCIRIGQKALITISLKHPDIAIWSISVIIKCKICYGSPTKVPKLLARSKSLFTLFLSSNVVSKHWETIPLLNDSKLKRKRGSSHHWSEGIDYN